MALKWPWPARPGTPARVEARPREEKAAGYGFVSLHTQGEARWTRRDYASLAREGYMRNAVAHRCIKLVAEAAATLPWVAFDGDEELSRHPLLDLLDAPNRRQSGAAFFEAVYGHLLISGNAYVETAGENDRTRELRLLRPDCVTVLADGDGEAVGLEYREGAKRRRVTAGPAAEGGALHLALFHPLDDHHGLAPLEAALTALDTHNAAGRWNKALLDNSARPSGALVYAPKEGGNLTDEQFGRLKVELEQGYAGASRAGRPMLLDGGLDWKAMGLSPRDMDFIENRNAAGRDIALAFGVPPMMLGIPGDNTYANYQEANRAFYRLTILPLVGKMAKELTRWLAPAYGEGIRVWYDPDQIPGLSADRDLLWARLERASFLTEDEKRAAVGYGPRGHS
jgi:HK97 family phage portal protein